MFWKYAKINKQTKKQTKKKKKKKSAQMYLNFGHVRPSKIQISLCIAQSDQNLHWTLFNSQEYKIPSCGPRRH